MPVSRQAPQHSNALSVALRTSDPLPAFCPASQSYDARLAADLWEASAEVAGLQAARLDNSATSLLKLCYWGLTVTCSPCHALQSYDARLAADLWAPALRCFMKKSTHAVQGVISKPDISRFLGLALQSYDARLAADLWEASAEVAGLPSKPSV